MISHHQKFLILLGSILFIAGCATAHPRKADNTDLANQVAALQSQVQAKDQQIQDLQNQLDNNRQPSNNFASGAGGDKSSIIHVAGVSVEDVQKALARAGYDPGPVDGRAGKKTKSAVKSFQKKHHLKADGIVGDKTWELLKA